MRAGRFQTSGLTLGRMTKMTIVSGHTSARRALKQRSVSGLAPFKVERVVTIRKTADLRDPPGISDRLLKVAISKKFLGTRQRMPRIWTSTGVVSSDGTYSNGRTDSVSSCSIPAAAIVGPKITARAIAIPHRPWFLLIAFLYSESSYRSHLS